MGCWAGYSTSGNRGHFTATAITSPYLRYFSAQRFGVIKPVFDTMTGRSKRLQRRSVRRVGKPLACYAAITAGALSPELVDFRARGRRIWLNHMVSGNLAGAHNCAALHLCQVQRRTDRSSQRDRYSARLVFVYDLQRAVFRPRLARRRLRVKCNSRMLTCVPD